VDDEHQFIKQTFSARFNVTTGRPAVMLQSSVARYASNAQAQQKVVPVSGAVLGGR
jgi:hypothetical protein